MGYTKYVDTARELYTAMQIIRQLNKQFDEFQGYQNPPADGEMRSWRSWLIKVNSAPGKETAVINYNAAVDRFLAAEAELRQLEAYNEVCRAVISANDDAEYLYILEGNTRNFYCKEQQRLNGVAARDCWLPLHGPKRIELDAQKKDAVRVQGDYSQLYGVEIRDQRVYHGPNFAHRDAIQIIPPLNRRNQGFIDRMAGAVIEHVTVDQCIISAENADLQGIFMSDGFCRDLAIRHCQIKTAGQHFITISGALTGCRVENNILQQVNGGGPPCIYLYPGRLGGNMADDGNLAILSFENASPYQYGAITINNNQHIAANGSAYTASPTVIDQRTVVSTNSSDQIDTLYLKSFDLDAYLDKYTTWTYADFKTHDPVGFRRLLAWLKLRIEEYSENKRIELDMTNEPILPLPQNEQRGSVLSNLKSALAMIEANDSAWVNRPLDKLPLPIRSFVIKRLAVAHGRIVDIPGLSASAQLARYARLKWFLPQAMPEDQAVETEPVAVAEVLPRNFSTLKIRALPFPATQGQSVSFSIDERQYFQHTDNLRYYWSLSGAVSYEPVFLWSSEGRSAGDYPLRLTVYKTSSGTATQAFSGSAVFTLLTSVADDTAIFVTPEQAFGDLRQYLRVSQAEVIAGQRLEVMLDASFIEQQMKQFDLSYYWALADYPASRESRFVIDTQALAVDSLFIRVTLHRRNKLTGSKTQLAGSLSLPVLLTVDA